MKDIWKNSAQLLSANVVAQAIGLLVYPILTRLYSPDDFGLLNLFLSIGNILIILGIAEYYNAIVLPREHKDAIAIFQVGGFLLVSVTLLVGLTIPFSDRIAQLFKTPELAQVWWMMPILIGMSGFWTLLSYYYMRRKKFRAIAAYQMTQSGLSAGAKVGFGYGKWFAHGQVIGTILALVIALCSSMIALGKRGIKELLQVDRCRCREVAKTYSNFPKFSMPRTIITYLAGQLPVLLLTPLFGTTYVGYWGMALLLAFTPISIVAKSFNQVFYGQMNEQVLNHLPLGYLIYRFIGISLLIMVPVFGGLCVYLPELTSWLLGAQWEMSGHIIRWMLPWLAVTFISNCDGNISDIFLKQKDAFYFELVIVILRVVGVLIGVYFHNFMIVVIGYSIGSFLGVSIQQLWLLSLVRRYDRSLT